MLLFLVCGRRVPQRANPARRWRQRDALVTELKERYPELAGELVDLFTRITANNQRAKQAGIDSVENLARGTTNVDIHRLIEAVRLPPFEPRAEAMGQMRWPVPVEHRIELPQSVHEGCGRQGAEMRRIGEHAAQHEAELQHSAIHKIG